MYDYISALWVHWVSLMSGVVSLVIGGLLRIQRLRRRAKKPKPTKVILDPYVKDAPKPPFERASVDELPTVNEVPSWTLIVIGVVCLFVAGYQTWSDEHERLLSTQQTLLNTQETLLSTQRDLQVERDNNTPKLSATLGSLITGETQELGGCQIFMLVEVRNLGAPSIAEGYTLTLSIPDRPPISLYPEHYRPGYELRDNGGVVAKFAADSAIYDKTMTAIQRGDFKKGWLRFVASGVTLEQLKNPETRYTLTFLDVKGTTCTLSFLHKVIHYQNTQATYFPGADNPFFQQDGRRNTERR